MTGAAADSGQSPAAAVRNPTAAATGAAETGAAGVWSPGELAALLGHRFPSVRVWACRWLAPKGGAAELRGAIKRAGRERHPDVLARLASWFGAAAPEDVPDVLAFVRRLRRDGLRDSCVRLLMSLWRRLGESGRRAEALRLLDFPPAAADRLARLSCAPPSGGFYDELRAFLSYSRDPSPLTYWRSVHGQEVDLLIGDRVAVEVKASGRSTERDASGLAALAEEGRFQDFYLVSQDPAHRRRKVGAAVVEFIPCGLFLRRLWDGGVAGRA